MTRMKALEAVAEAARQWRDWEADHSQSMVDRTSLWHALDDALIALDALPADPEPARGEVVEVEAWIRNNGNDPSIYVVEGAGTWDGKWRSSMPRSACVRITALVPRPPATIPTVEASCLPLVQERGE